MVTYLARGIVWDRDTHPPWPESPWRGLAFDCEWYGAARPVLDFFRLLGILPAVHGPQFARERARSMSAEHLALAAGQVGRLLLRLRNQGGPSGAVRRTESVYRVLVGELKYRVACGEIPRLPDVRSHLRPDRRRSRKWDSVESWEDVLPRDALRVRIRRRIALRSARTAEA